MKAARAFRRRALLAADKRAAKFGLRRVPAAVARRVRAHAPAEVTQTENISGGTQ